MRGARPVGGLRNLPVHVRVMLPGGIDRSGLPAEEGLAVTTERRRQQPEADRNGASPRRDAPAATAAGPPRRPRFALHTFDSLKDRHFRWFFSASMSQMASMQMQQVMRSYVAFLITGSYAALGIVALAGSIPALIFSLVGGAIADRIPQKKWAVQVGQAVTAVNSLAIAVLLYTDLIRLEHLVIAAVVQAMQMALVMPSRQSMIPELVGTGDRLMNAVALNAAGMNSVRLFAPALGGFLAAAFGAAWVYFLMTAMYLLAMMLMFQVPDTTTAERAPRGSFKREASDALRNIWLGLKYMKQERTIGALLVVNLLIVICSMPYMFLLAGFVMDVLGEGPDTIGMLISVGAVGSLISALTIASRPWRRRGRIFLLGSAFQGLFLFLAFTVSTSALMMMPLMFLMGIGQSLRQSLSNVLVQTYVDNDYRGRVMSIYMMQMSLAQFGAFAGGIVAAMLGPRVALGGLAMLVVIISLGAFVFVPRLRNLD